MGVDPTVVAAFNQEKALVGAFSVITNLRMELFEALVDTEHLLLCCCFLSYYSNTIMHVYRLLPRLPGTGSCRYAD